MHLVRNSVIERGVWPPGIVEPDPLGYGTQRICLGPKLCTQPILLLKNAVYPFSQGVLGAVVGFRHADAQV